MTTSRLTLLALAAVCTWSCRSSSPAGPAPRPHVAPTLAQYESAVGMMFELATGGPMPAAERHAIAEKLASRELTIAGYVADLAARPETLHYAPIVLFPFESQKRAVGLAHGFHTLTSFKDGNREILRIEDRPPCDPKSAVKVKPWWAPTTDVWVCADDYRPTVLRTQTGRVCPNQSPDCPCGANLMSCAPEEIFDQLQTSAQAEFNDTIVARVSDRATLASLFQGDTSVRDRYAEWLYRRAQVQRGAPSDSMLHIDDWSETSTPTSRPDLGSGMHAGILTTPHVQSTLFDPRERMQVMSYMLWCVEPRSVHVQADKVLDLPVEFRALDGWAKLAHMPVCDGCHARLDYGAQFWLAWESGGRYDANARPQQTMKLYMDDQTDLRGETTATPVGFATLAVAQPEFGHCMSKRVVEHFLGRTYEPADSEAVNDAYATTGTYQALLSAALLRVAEHMLEPQPTPMVAEPHDAQPTQQRGRVTLTGHLKGTLNDECASLCHGGLKAPLGVRFDVDAIDRARLEKALDQVAFGRMPPPSDVELAPARRRQVVHELVAQLWSDPSAQMIARRYFDREMNNVNTYRPDAIVRQVRARVGLDTPASALGSIDRYYLLSPRDKLEYTPDLAVSTVLSAVDACKQAGKPLATCVSSAAALDGIVSE